MFIFYCEQYKSVKMFLFLIINKNAHIDEIVRNSPYVHICKNYPSEQCSLNIVYSINKVDTIKVSFSGSWLNELALLFT